VGQASSVKHADLLKAHPIVIKRHNRKSMKKYLFTILSKLYLLGYEQTAENNLLNNLANWRFAPGIGRTDYERFFYITFGQSQAIHRFSQANIPIR
jgi:hypothetical protein